MCLNQYGYGVLSLVACVSYASYVKYHMYRVFLSINICNVIAECLVGYHCLLGHFHRTHMDTLNRYSLNLFCFSRTRFKACARTRFSSMLLILSSSICPPFESHTTAQKKTVLHLCVLLMLRGKHNGRNKHRTPRIETASAGE